MKKFFIGSFLYTIMILLIVFMFVNFFIYRFPDWIVRIVGIFMLINIFLISYNINKKIKR
ncbi:MAG: hypothetical protein PWP28_481 [Oceanotoga sp.]|nr:hypothetical protein [Oceanotoga sp.]